MIKKLKDIVERIGDKPILWNLAIYGIGNNETDFIWEIRYCYMREIKLRYIQAKSGTEALKKFWELYEHIKVPVELDLARVPKLENV